MTPIELYRHPDEPASGVTGIAAIIERPAPDRVVLRYVIEDPDEKMTIPDGSGKRRDGLWMESCLEFFLGRASGDDYREFNFSPGGDWAAYEFDRYREHRRQSLMPDDPAVTCERDGDTWVVEAALTLNDLPENGACNLTAVVKEGRDTSHWAALHAPGKPDFHDRHCFAVAFPRMEQA